MAIFLNGCVIAFYLEDTRTAIDVIDDCRDRRSC